MDSITKAEVAVDRENTQISELEASADVLTIETAEQLEASSTLLAAIKGRQKDMTQLRLSITKPMDESKKRVMEVFRPALDRLEAAEGMIKSAVLTYTREQEQRRREEQARLDEEAERERRRLERLAEKQRKAGREERAEATEERVEEVAAPTVASAPAPTGSVHVRTTWSAEVVDLAELVKACSEGRASLDLLQPDMTALNGMARSLKEKFSIPGVRAVSEQGVAARSQ